MPQDGISGVSTEPWYPNIQGEERENLARKKGEVGAFSVYFLRLTWKLMALKHILWLEPTNHWDDIINQSQDWMPNPLTSHFLSRGCPKSKELPKITWRI